MQGLKDIKPIVEINDHSFVLFVIYIASAIVIFLLLLFIFTQYKKRKRNNPKTKAMQKLKNMNFSDSKKSAYCFSKNAILFINQKNQELFEEIEKELINFKYKKDEEIAPFSQELIEKMKKFIRATSIW